MSRRLHTAEVQRLLHQMEEQMATRYPSNRWVLTVDGKPLLVGSHSKDPDAEWGHVRRGWAKGYKLHAVYGPDPIPMRWEATALNVAEPDVARQMIPSLRPGEGYILGDSAYDSNPLHDSSRGAGTGLQRRQG